MCISGCADAKNALVKECLTPFPQLRAANGFLEFLLHQDGCRIPVSWEAYDEV